MPDETRHESADLEDYQVMDSSDTLDDAPGDDPLDRGVIPPERWSAGMRFGTTESEQADGESLDQLLAEEEPEPGLHEEPDDESLGRAADDDDALADEDVDGLLLDDGPDPRAGRLVSAGDEDDLFPGSDGDLIGTDAGIDGGAATAEEAAVHVVEEDDYDIRSE
jgi:hypothetical protein